MSNKIEFGPMIKAFNSMGLTVRDAAESFAVFAELLAEFDVTKKSCEDCERIEERLLRSLDL